MCTVLPSGIFIQELHIHFVSSYPMASFYHKAPCGFVE